MSDSLQDARDRSRQFADALSRLSCDEYLSALRQVGWPLDESIEGRIRCAFKVSKLFAFYSLREAQINLDDVDERDPSELLTTCWSALESASKMKLPTPVLWKGESGGYDLLVPGVVRQAVVANIPIAAIELAGRLLSGLSVNEFFVLPPNDLQLDLVFVPSETWRAAVQASLIPDTDVYILE